MVLTDFLEFTNIETPSNKRRFIIQFKCPECGKDAKSNYLLLERFGKERFFCAKCLREHTNMKKYGVSNVMHNKEISDKMSSTKKEKYGDNYYNDWYAKQSISCREKYGVDNYGLSEEYNKKIDDYISKNYDSKEDYYKSLKEKSDSAIIEKYGSTDVFYKNRYKKTQETIFEKYGVNNISQTDIWKNIHLSKVIKDLSKTNNEQRSFLERDGHFYTYCGLCKKEFENKPNNIFYRCPECFPKLENNSTSFGEKEVLAYIQSIYNKDIQHRRKSILENHKKEIDIYLPEKNLGIEFNGIFWHSKESISDYSDFIKYKDAEKVGIRLIEIWENEWNEKQQIVCSILKSAIGISASNNIYARKCVVKEITNKECYNFCNSNHLQGGINSSVNLGLFYNDALVQIMCFNKSRFSKKYEWEMMRECSLLDMRIIGGKGKLLAYFEYNYKPKSLVSYCDKRYFTGKSYVELGFNLIKETNPAFYVLWKHKIYNRLRFTKPAMKKLKDFNFDENLTQVENILNNNGRFLLDCGQFTFLKTYK